MLALVTSGGRLLEKDTLLKSVWPDVAVEEGNLTKGVFSLRQLLEQEGVRYIETVPKRGYRFTATVTREASTAPALDGAPGGIGRSARTCRSGARELHRCHTLYRYECSS